MSLLTEHIPEDDRARFAGEIVDLKFLCPLDDFRIVCARLTQAGEIAFDVGHKHSHTAGTEIFRERLQSHGFPCARGTGNQAVAIRHSRQQKNRFLGFRDENWFGHNSDHDLGHSFGDCPARPLKTARTE